MAPLNEHEELKRIAPVLHGLPKADPFVVPEGFFDRFPHEVQAAIVAERASGAGPSWSWFKRLAIALPVILLAGVGAWWMVHNASGPDVVAEADVTPLTDVELDAFDEPDLLAAWEEVSDTSSSSAMLGTVGITLEEHELLAYLEHENTDLNDLITDFE